MKGLLIALVLLPLTAIASPPLTADNLRLMAGQAEREERLRASRVDPNDLASLLPGQLVIDATMDKQAREKEPTLAPVSTKYTASPAVKQSTAVNASRPSTAVATVDRDVYIPPPRQATGKTRIMADAVPVASQSRFGIRMGTWLRARLERNTTSADPGRLELVLIDEVVGDVKGLGQGTLLFADKAYNQSTQRLDMQVVKAITPEGDEFTLRGLIYDDKRNAGLPGLVTGQPVSQSIGKGVSRGLLDASRVALSGLSNSAVVNAVTDRTAEAVITDKQTLLDVQNTQPYTIYVTAQDVLIRVEETF